MKKFKFLIIGSGPGGTTVLKTLLDNNIEDVGIIEEGDDSKDTVMGSFDDLINKYRYGGADIIFSKPNIEAVYETEEAELTFPIPVIVNEIFLFLFQ